MPPWSHYRHYHSAIQTVNTVSAPAAIKPEPTLLSLPQPDRRERFYTEMLEGRLTPRQR